MLAHGHVDARHYPVGMVWVESAIVTTRVNDQLATEALLIQGAISSAFSKEGQQGFKDMIDRLSER